MSLSPEERTLRARIGAYAQKAQHDVRKTTAAGRAAVNANYLRRIQEQFPDLPLAEQQRRAEALRRAHMTELSFKAARAKRRAREATP